MPDRERTRRQRAGVARHRTGRRDDDVGTTLTEVLIGVIVMGIIMASITAAVIVVVKQQASAGGRLNNSRSQQNLGLWLPADMASAETFDDSPGASPCGSSCPANVNVGGSSAVMVTWSGIEIENGVARTTTTNVSYRYVDSGSTWDVFRVACTRVENGPYSCRENAVLRNVPAPAPGFVAGVTAPTVMKVLPPVQAGDTGAGVLVSDSDRSKNAKTVEVTVDGGGNPDTAGGGGQIRFSTTAGSTIRDTLDADSNVRIPTFTDARSRCGGSLGVIVDSSGSIGGSSMTLVNQGVNTMISQFKGTPMKIQVVDFDSTATVLGGRYYDMLVDADVTALTKAVSKISSGGATNWEDGIFSMFYEKPKSSDVTPVLQARLPSKVLFFTDGQPNGDRLSYSQPLAVADPDDWWVPAGALRRGLNRAERIIAPFRGSTTFIGVGVGPNIEPDQRSGVLQFVRGYKMVGGTRVYAPTFTAAETTTVNTLNTEILTKFITGSATSKNIAVFDAATNTYTNAATADMYILPKWNQFADALKAIALADCGGTLTVQTMEGGVNSTGTFTYGNTALTSDAGATITPNASQQVTDHDSPSGTFDFTIGTGGWVTADIKPVYTTAMDQYAPVVTNGSSWSCEAGGVALPVTAIPVENTGVWKGARVKVAANQAVSCQLHVVKL